MNFLTKIFGDPNAREVREFSNLIESVNSLEGEISAFSDEELRGKTAELKEKLSKYQKSDIIITNHAGLQAFTRDVDLEEVKENVVNPIKLVYAKTIKKNQNK